MLGKGIRTTKWSALVTLHFIQLLNFNASMFRMMFFFMIICKIVFCLLLLSISHWKLFMKLAPKSLSSAKTSFSYEIYGKPSQVFPFIFHEIPLFSLSSYLSLPLHLIYQYNMQFVITIGFYPMIMPIASIEWKMYFSLWK